MTRKDGTRPTEGRPSDYTQDTADKICEGISLGSSLRTVAKIDGMPSVATIFKWMRENDQFLNQYARATEERTEAMSEDILDISDDGTNDYMETTDGKIVYNGDAIQRSRLRVDTRKWLMAKMKPKKYGDKIDVTSGGEKIIPVPILGGLTNKYTNDDKEG